MIEIYFIFTQRTAIKHFFLIYKFSDHRHIGYFTSTDIESPGKTTSIKEQAPSDWPIGHFLD